MHINVSERTTDAEPLELRVAATEPVTLPLTDRDGVPDALALGLPLALSEPVRLTDADTDVLAVCAGRNVTGWGQCWERLW
jgi:hypothetical protein